MCIKCEKLENYKNDLDNCKLLLRSLIDLIDEIQDKVICDNILIEDQDATYIFKCDSVHDSDSDTDTDNDMPELEIV